eukprot:6213602-Pleurochrysis_carterae.AAC.4
MMWALRRPTSSAGSAHKSSGVASNGARSILRKHVATSVSTSLADSSPADQKPTMRASRPTVSSSTHTPVNADSMPRRPSLLLHRHDLTGSCPAEAFAAAAAVAVVAAAAAARLCQRVTVVMWTIYAVCGAGFQHRTSASTRDRACAWRP